MAAAGRPPPAAYAHWTRLIVAANGTMAKVHARFVRTGTSSSTSTGQKTQNGDASKSDDTASSGKTTEKTVEFQATATGNGTVIWTKSGSSNTEQFSGTWSKTFTGDEAKDLTGVSVTGDIMGGNDQQVTCKIIVNGEEKDAKEAGGSAGSAMCTVPLF